MHVAYAFDTIVKRILIATCFKGKSGYACYIVKDSRLHLQFLQRKLNQSTDGKGLVTVCFSSGNPRAGHIAGSGSNSILSLGV